MYYAGDNNEKSTTPRRRGFGLPRTAGRKTEYRNRDRLGMRENATGIDKFDADSVNIHIG
jgi:hypothetical protein